MHINHKIKYPTIIVFIIVGYFLLYKYTDFIQAYTFCLFKTTTHIPCPACGSTRATIQLLHGNVVTSLLINPLGLVSTILFIISICWMLIDIFKKEETFYPFLKKKWNTKLQVILFLFIILNWVWNISKGL